VKVGIVTAADPAVGLGHARRQAAVARALAAVGHEVVVAANAWPPEAVLSSTCAVLLRPTMDVATLEGLLEEMACLACERFVIDLPERTVAHRRSTVVHRDALGIASGQGVPTGLGAAEVRVGSDLHARHTSRIERTQGGDVVVFGGRDYVLVGEEFAAAGTGDPPHEPGHVLVTHGGADPWRLTERTLCALALTRHVRRVTVVAGSAFGRELLAGAGYGRLQVTVLHDVRDMPRVMRSTSLAVINGGTTRYELCVAGTPFVAIAVNPLQHGVNQLLEEHGVCRAVGIADEVSDRDLADAIDGVLGDDAACDGMRRRKGGLFDTLGAARVAQLVTSEQFPHTSDPAAAEASLP